MTEEVLAGPNVSPSSSQPAGPHRRRHVGCLSAFVVPALHLLLKLSPGAKNRLSPTKLELSVWIPGKKS